MIDLALSVLPTDAGPIHVKFLLEWQEPEKYFNNLNDDFVEHESVTQLKQKVLGNSMLTLEQCLEHYTKAETLSTEDAWRCPHCQQYLPVVKTLGLWSLPDILVIHFKRFRQQHIKGPQAAKLTTTVKFPLNGFDMSPHLARHNAAAATTTNLSNNSTIDSGGGGEYQSANEDNWSPWKKIKRKDTNLYQQLQQNHNNHYVNHHNHQQLQQQYKDNRYDLYAVCYHQVNNICLYFLFVSLYNLLIIIYLCAIIVIFFLY